MIIEITIETLIHTLDLNLFETNLLEREKTFRVLPDGSKIIWMGGPLKKNILPSKLNVFNLIAEINEINLEIFSFWLAQHLNEKALNLFINGKATVVDANAIETVLLSYIKKH